jgi:3-oxoacyl-[acyl-carrier protein] reductase
MAHTDHKRVIIVTGAARGLGKEIALKFGREGDRVVVNYLTSERAALAAADEISQIGGESVTFRADVRNADEVDAMMSDIVNRWGNIDILINNAGVTQDRILLRMTEQEWDDVIDTNLTGVFHCIRAASKIMSKQRNGCIINISSLVGVQGREGQSNYAASKAGLIGLTKTCAKELGRYNIKANVILPGYMPTDMGDTISDKVLASILQANALNRVSEPQEVAEFIYHLSLMNNVSGQVFNLDSRVM